MNFIFIIICQLEKENHGEIHAKVIVMLEKSQQHIKDLPLILAAKAELEKDKSLDELPDWAKQIIVTMREPPSLDFTADYQDVKADVEVEEL